MNEENDLPAWRELMVGDKAPKLQTGKWLQGEPVMAFDSSHVYVVELWSTWCGPCVQSIPHLNQLCQKFKDKGVIVIGVNVWDSDDEVAPFMKQMGSSMTYHIALDDKSSDSDGFISSTWWKKKVNHHGIPTAFVINRDGVIAWIGHPLGLKEEALEEIVCDRQDLAKATTDYQRDFESNQQYLGLQSKLFSARRAKNWGDAWATLKAIDSLYPNMTDRFNITRLQLLLGQKKLREAYDFADSLSKRFAKDDGWQNALAWTIAVSESPEARCLGLAEIIAEHAVQLTQGTNSASLDTLARVQFMLGKKSEAIVTEEKAVCREDNEKRKKALGTTLDSYREGKLPKVEY